MAATISNLPPTLTVAPGGEAHVDVRVRNTGTIVDQFTLEVVGAPAEWATLEPAAVSLFPGAEEEVRISFSPPRRASTPAGAVPYGVRVASREDPEGGFVEEGALELEAFTEIFAELLPRTTRGSLFARQEVALDNTGNTPVRALLSATDAEGSLRFRFGAEALAAPPGTAAFSRIVIRPRKPLWLGSPRTYPYRVLVEPEGAEAITLDSTMVQQPFLSRRLIPLLAALALLALLWAIVLRPSIESGIDDRVVEAVADKSTDNDLDGEPNEEDADDDNDGVEDGADSDANGNGVNDAIDPDAGSTGTGGGGVAAGGGGGGGAAGVTDGRLQVNCPTKCVDSFAVGEGQRLAVTDIVLGNPDGSSGTLTLRKKGKPILVHQLDNFRDLDFHFVTPVLIGSNDKLELRVQCPGSCSAGLFFTGTLASTRSEA